MLFRKLANRLASQPKTIFLIDGIGAAVSAFFLGIVLTAFEPFFGMPKWILVPLSLIAATFAVYSFSCYFFASRRWSQLLFIISLLNFTYCFVTAGFLIQSFRQLSNIGQAYFTLEIFIILTLAVIELRISRHLGRKSEELL